MQRLEPALSRAGANPLPCRNVFGKALQGDGPEIAILEHASGQFACARRNDHRARFGGRLEASGKIGRLSDHRLLLIPFPNHSEFMMYGNDVMDLTILGLLSM